MGVVHHDDDHKIGLHFVAFFLYLIAIMRIFHGLNHWQSNGWYIIRSSAYFLLVLTLIGFISVGYNYHNHHDDCVHIAH